MEKSKLAHTVGFEINIAKAKSIRIILSSKGRCGQARKSPEDKAQKIPHMPEVNGKIPNIQQQVPPNHLQKTSGSLKRMLLDRNP